MSNPIQAPQALAIYDASNSQLPVGILELPDATTSPIGSLSQQEEKMLRNYETIIEQGEQTIIEVGQALSAINRGRLYRAEYGSFQEYCTAKWGFGRRRGYDLMKASEVAQELCANGAQSINLNERHLRAVTKLKSTKERVDAFARATELAQNKKVTSRHIEEAVNEMLGTAKPVVVDVEEILPEQKSAAVVVPTNFIDRETNEQAIGRLFSSIREFASHHKWQPRFEDMIDELEARIGTIIKAASQEKAA